MRLLISAAVLGVGVLDELFQDFDDDLSGGECR